MDTMRNMRTCVPGRLTMQWDTGADQVAMETGEGHTPCPRNGQAGKPSAMDCPSIFLPHLPSCVHCLVSASEDPRVRQGVLENSGFLITRGESDVL